jgi:hypothetical protein
MRIKTSIRRQKQHDKLTNHPIKKFFHRVITTTIPTRHIPIHTSPPPPTETTPNIKQISQTALTFLSTCFTYQDPHIPIPKSDYRPPLIPLKYHLAKQNIQHNLRSVKLTYRVAY